MLGIACNNEQKVKVMAAPKTSTGKPAQLDGGLQGTVVSGDGSVEAVPGEPNAVFCVSGDGVGTTVFTLSGDADLGAGVVLLQESVELEVSGAQAASFGLAAGQPEPK